MLQNIGSSKPEPSYLQGLPKLADQSGFILVFDEVKTGFRHGIGGYAKIAGVMPDLAVFAKALANGTHCNTRRQKELMRWFVHPDLLKRVLLAGTYNAHPVPTAAAIATIEPLLTNGGELNRDVAMLGEQM